MGREGEREKREGGEGGREAEREERRCGGREVIRKIDEREREREREREMKRWNMREHHL